MKKHLFFTLSLLACTGLKAQSTTATNNLTGATPSTPNQYLGSSTLFDVRFMTNSVERMRLTSTGRLGIGTTAPMEKFHLHEGVMKLSGTNGYGGPMILFGGSATVSQWGEWALEYTSATPGREGLEFWKSFGSVNTGHNYLFLANTGKVGINTNNPTAQLTVNGNVLIGDPAAISLPWGYKLYVQQGILTERLKVAVETTANWSDYVFEKSYKLMPLNEVEKFIASNKHLPGVPSAEEMVIEGLDVAEMDAKLLEKVEELTLYIIELQKQIDELKNQPKN